MLPGEADPAVDLDVLGRGVEVGLRAVGLGQAGHHRQLVGVLGRRPAGVVGRRLGRLDLEQHVGALVLDGLEAADGSAELDPDLGVLDRASRGTFWAPPTCSAARATAARSRVLDRPGSSPAVGADQPGRRPGELQTGLLAGLVHRRQRGPGQAGGVTAHREQADAGVGAATTRIRSATWPSMTNVLCPFSVQPSPDGVAARVTPSSSHRPVSSVKASVAMVSPEAMPGSRYSLAALVARGEQGVGRQGHGREVRGAQQRRAHLLEHHDQLHVGEPRPAELLGDGQALQAELLGHLATTPPGRSPRWSPSAGGPRSRATCPRGSGGRTCGALPAPR